MRLFWLLLALIPGAPAIVFGRWLAGASLFVLATAGWNLGLYLNLFVEGGAWGGVRASVLEGAGFVVGGLCTLISLLWTAMLTSSERAERRRLAADAAVVKAQSAILTDDLDAARLALQEGLRADPRDVDLLFLEWSVARDRGDERRARRVRRRLRRLDLDEKWTWEVERRLAAPSVIARPGKAATPKRGEERELELEHDR